MLMASLCTVTKKPEERNLGNAKIEVYHGIFKKPNLTLTMQPLKKPCN